MGTHERIIMVYKWFHSAMAKAGRKVSFPKGTNPAKTYQYRYLKSFIQRVDKWKLPDDLTKAMVNCVVRYAEKNKMLDRGVSLLNMKNILAICHDDLKNSSSKGDICEHLTTCKSFIESNNETLYHKHGSFSNIVRWYQMGKLTLPFMAVSKSCSKAISGLPATERREIPSDFDLLNSRIKLLSNNKREVVEIMGSDFVGTIN